MVILLSTRGTAGSDIWFMCLADKPMVRSYHLRDYDWTPLSQNPVQKCDDTVSASDGERQRYTQADRFRRLRWLSHSTTAPGGHRRTWPRAEASTHHIRRWGAKSFVDDLVLSRGVVLSRADLFCDLLRLSPMTRRFVRFRRTYLLNLAASATVGRPGGQLMIIIDWLTVPIDASGSGFFCQKFSKSRSSWTLQMRYLL